MLYKIEMLCIIMEMTLAIVPKGCYISLLIVAGDTKQCDHLMTCYLENDSFYVPINMKSPGSIVVNLGAI